MTNITKATPEFHFYGSTSFDWATGATRQEVIEKLAKAGSWNLTAAKVKASGPMYAFTVKVLVPQDTSYGIAYYMPQGVECVDKVEVNILNKKGHVTLI